MYTKPTQLLMGSKAKKAIYKGVNSIYEPVRQTFGPEGKNALIYRPHNLGYRISNDGYTVAEAQEPKNPFIQMASKTFKESCKRTNEKVGDGTSCTTILGGKLFNELYKITEKNDSSLKQSNNKGTQSLKREILKEAEKVKEAIKKSAKKVKSLKEMERLAIVSVEDEELGKIIAKMAWEVKEHGFIDVVDGFKGKIETELVKGMKFPAKVPGKQFVNNPKKFEMVLEDTNVLLTNYKLINKTEFVNALKPLIEKNPKIAIIAPEFSEEVLEEIWKATYVLVKKDGKITVDKGPCDIFPIKAPSLRTDQFEDLEVYFDAHFIDKGKGEKLSSLTEKDFGFAEKIIVKDSENKEDAIATGGAGTFKTKVKVEDEKEVEVVRSEVEKRIEMLQGQLENTRQHQFKLLLERRIASMASAVGVIKVGGSTKAEILYLKHKIEDAVFACRASLRGGYVKGGGICLKEIADKMDDNNILKSTLLAPYEQIQSSVEGGVEITEDIIDPAEAIYYAVEHAIKVVANLITCSSITVQMSDPIPEEGGHAIAKAIWEMVRVQKIKEGQLKDSEKEMWDDALGGLTEDEQEYLQARD